MLVIQLWIFSSYNERCLVINLDVRKMISFRNFAKCCAKNLRSILRSDQ